MILVTCTMAVGIKSQYLVAQFILNLWLLVQTKSQVMIVKEPAPLLISANRIGVFSCEALCNGFPSCSGYWILNNTPHYTIAESQMNSSFTTSENYRENTLTLTVNASEATNNTSIRCKYEADGNHDGFNESETVFLFVISNPPISENPLISKTATHVTLMWSPPFLWPGQRIQRWNITVTNRNDGNSSHHILNSSFTDPIISFSMSWSYLQLIMSTMTCTEIIFSISPVSEAAPKVMQTVNISDWIWNSVTQLLQCQEITVSAVNASVVFIGDGTPLLGKIYIQLPTINSSYIIFTVDVGNEQEDLATYENVTEEYLVQSTVHSQTVTSPEYHDIFKSSTGNKSVHNYTALTAVFASFTVILFTSFFLIIGFLLIGYRKGMIVVNFMKSEKKVSKVMVTNPIYEGDGPVYDSVQTQDVMNSVTKSSMLQSILTTDEQDTNIYQSLSDVARYKDRPVQLHHSLYTNAASDSSDTGTPVDTPTESMPLTAPRIMALKNNGQERNKLRLTLSLGGNSSATMTNENFPGSVATTNAIADADEVYIEMSPAGIQYNSLSSD